MTHYHAVFFVISRLIKHPPKAGLPSGDAWNW